MRVDEWAREPVTGGDRDSPRYAIDEMTEIKTVVVYELD